MQLSAQPSTNSSQVTYRADAPSMQCASDGDEISFEYTFTKPTVISGCSRAILYMSCSVPTGRDVAGNESAEFDVHVQLRKADKNGDALEHINIPLVDCQANGLSEPPTLNKFRYLGPHGCLRARFRKVKSYTSDGFPEHDLSVPVQDTIAKDEVVRLEIGIVQAGMAFDVGEKLVFKVSGHEMTIAEYEFMKGNMPNYNRGQHTLYCGLNKDGESSRLILPVMEGFDWRAPGLPGMNETYA